jgi:hypothetical protein
VRTKWHPTPIGSLPLDERKRLHAVVTYQVLPKLQIGAELFHQTADSRGTPATSSAGIGWRYDLNDNLHLLGYIRRRIENTDEMDRYSWYASILFTF